MNLEDRLLLFAYQPTAVERSFIEHVRAAHDAGVSYGWMQQIIEWEWQDIDPRHAWGPEFLEAVIAERDDLLIRLEAYRNASGT